MFINLVQSGSPPSPLSPSWESKYEEAFESTPASSRRPSASRVPCTYIGLFCQILAETHKKIRHASTALFPRVPRGGIDSRSQPGQPERTILPLDATLDAFWCPQSHITHSISKHTQHQSRAIARFKDRIVQKDN